AAYAKPRKIFHNRPLEWLAARYARLLGLVIDRPVLAIVPGLGAVALAVFLAIAVGQGVLPELDEGSLWLPGQLPPRLSLKKASAMADELRRATLEFEEVSYMVSQLGRNDDGTDPWTPSHIECSVGLRPYATWPRGEGKHDLIARMAARYAKIPGITVGF